MHDHGSQHADRRPRIHIWRHPANDTVSWSFGPCGKLEHAPTAGQALDAGLATIKHQPAVIIFEGERHG
jgi:hypothetical protein